MDKLKAYLGLAAALALLVFACMPTGRGFADDLTPLDTLTLTRLTVGQESVGLESLKRMAHFQRVVAENCSVSPGTVEGYPYDCPRYTSEYVAAAESQVDKLAAFEPAMPALLQEYSAALELEPVETYRFLERAVMRQPRTIELQTQIAQGITKYVDAQGPVLTLSIYGIYGLLFLVVGLMAIWRRGVGALLLLPFTLLFEAAGAGARVAKDIHEKV